MLLYCFLLPALIAASAALENLQSEEWPTCDKDFLNGQYSIAHKLYCDRFFSCINGTALLMQCHDGFAYVPFQGCKLLHEVDCGNRTKLQEPQRSETCPRLYGLYEDPKGCGKYISCYNGTATSGQCPDSLIFDVNGKYCRTPTNEERKKCLPAPALLGCTIGPDNTNQGSCTWFQCPGLNVFPFGDHSRHPYPGHCHYYIMCLRDGHIKIGSCPPGLAFNPVTLICESESAVQSCNSQVQTSPQMPSSESPTTITETYTFRPAH